MKPGDLVKITADSVALYREPFEHSADIDMNFITGYVEHDELGLVLATTSMTRGVTILDPNPGRDVVIGWCLLLCGKKLGWREDLYFMTRIPT